MKTKTLLKRTYSIIPFKKQAFSLLKKFWKPHENIYRHLHFVGVFTIPVDDSSFKMKHHGYQVENEIFWAGLTGGWEKVSLGLWIKLCREADVVFDIGANTGIYALIAKTVNPECEVYAFEPVARVFEKLEENIALNNYDIVSVQKAVSNYNGTAKFYDTYTDHIYSVTVNKNLNAPETRVIETSAEAITLDTFIKNHSIEKLDLLKIDVETHEPEVLEGFSEYIEKYKPSILIEILNDEIGERVEKLTNGLGYLYFNINEKGSIRKVDKITKSDYYNYLLCNQKTADDLGIS